MLTSKQVKLGSRVRCKVEIKDRTGVVTHIDGHDDYGVDFSPYSGPLTHDLGGRLPEKTGRWFKLMNLMLAQTEWDE